MIKTIDELILNQATERQLTEYLAQPTHALMLTGPVGVGLGTIARTLAHQLAGADMVYLTPTQHKQQKTSIINSDDIAGIIPILRDRRANNLAIVVDGADQTAAGVFERMLKLIEEPVPGVYYIFTAHSLSVIPMTILSRSSLIKIIPPEPEQCVALYQGMDAKTASQVKFVADRLPAMIERLASDAEQLAACVTNMTAAKDFLQGRVADRLALIDTVADKESALRLCRSLTDLLLRVSERGVARKSILAKRLQLLEATATNLAANGNVRIQLIDLAVNFG